ncbi:hypothetical protein [Silanimonas lenta]|nr:hypothetical protein [Silanimonas lenta]
MTLLVLLAAALLGLCAIGLLMLWHRLIAGVLRLFPIGHVQGDASKTGAP